MQIFRGARWLAGALFFAVILSNRIVEAQAAGAGFAMVSNDRFGAQAVGLAGAIPVEIGGAGVTTRAEVWRNALRQNQLSPASRAHAEQTLRRLHLLGAQTRLTRSLIAAPVRNGQLAIANSILPVSSLATRGGIAPRVAPLTFVFQGFSADQQTKLQTFAQQVYPILVQIYGDPAQQQQGKIVTVIYDTTEGDGYYMPPQKGSSTSGGTILIDTTSGGVKDDQNNYNLTRQMLIAFHGPLIFAFDAWELGFSDAAALIANYLAAGSPANFDPSQLGVYVLPVYDLFNRPELGNSGFFKSGTSANLGFYRAGIAQAAWLKVYVENPNFFRQFNAAYYTQVNADNVALAGVPLAGNTPALKRLAASYVPTVEGLGFMDWYRRQYVLDTSITMGDKLWLGIFPESNLVSGDTRSHFTGEAQRYRTLANGDESPLGGTALLTAYDEKGNDITAKSAELGKDNHVLFNAYGEAEVNSQNAAGTALLHDLPVAGFSNTSTPDQGRITLALTIGTSRTVAYFPYGVAGTADHPAAFYGATVGTNTGSVTIQSSSVMTSTNAVARGAFTTSSSLIYPSGPRVKTTFSLAPSDGAAAKTFYRNSAWAMYQDQAQSLRVLLETAPGNGTVALNLRPTATNNLRMISLPLTPTQSDEAAVLGVNPKTLLLARYRPNLSPQTFVRNGITYGVTADRHEIYPNISEPFMPGHGYWLKLPTNLSTTVRGGEPSRSVAYEVPLLGGWNQIGVPYNLTFSLSALKVRLLDGASVSFATAVTNGWIVPGVWRWLPTGGYSRVDTGDATNQRLVPFEGYYLFTRQAQGLSLVFDAHAPIAAVTAVRGLQWQLSLSATTSGARDADNAFGVVTMTAGQPQYAVAAKPPAATRALTLSFLSGGTSAADATGAGAATGWAESCVAPSTKTASWPFIVDGADYGATVRLNWGDPHDVAANLDLTLVDETTGQRIPMINANQVYSYTFTAGGVARHLHIEAKTLPPAIQKFSATPLAGSHSAMLAAILGVSGMVDVEIQVLNGAMKRSLAADQVVSPKTTHWMWDGRDDAGRSVTAGRYVARLRLTDERGVAYASSVAFDLP